MLLREIFLLRRLIPNIIWEISLKFLTRTDYCQHMQGCVHTNDSVNTVRDVLSHLQNHLVNVATILLSKGDKVRFRSSVLIVPYSVYSNNLIGFVKALDVILRNRCWGIIICYYKRTISVSKIYWRLQRNDLPTASTSFGIAVCEVVVASVDAVGATAILSASSHIFTRLILLALNQILVEYNSNSSG